jgi:hypothetical protein
MDILGRLLNRTKLTPDFGREFPLTRARLQLEPSELLKARWKRIILGTLIKGSRTSWDYAHGR